jgi:tRNA-Thr(GGU) m(6)t(6)A37 methyltransferase TsaA
MTIDIEPIGRVEAERDATTDDFWGGSRARILLAERFRPEALQGLEEFSHAEILFLFDRVDPARVEAAARRPRGNPDWPEVGIFAQRAKARPNRIGSTICRVLSREGRVLTVAELDAIDGTPVLDIKPVIASFLPREPVREPRWTTELMRDYWRSPGSPDED